LEAKVDPRWLGKGRRVLMFDGSTVSMPDTEANQQAYPQLYNQKPGGRLSDRPDRGSRLAFLRSDPQPGNLSLRRQGTR
jgi:hypothetical protein